MWIAACAVGGLGAMLRFLVDGAVSARWGGSWPVGTLAVNVSGSLLLGFIGALALSDDAALLAGTAAVGGYTTFSTWMFETQRLAEDDRLTQAGLNVVLSLALGIAAAATGRWIGEGL